MQEAGKKEIKALCIYVRINNKRAKVQVNNKTCNLYIDSIINSKNGSLTGNIITIKKKRVIDF